MLSLREIVKTYVSGDTAVHALRGVSIDFRENEFVSILGPSGCGKTTLLNIVGGLDRYDSGDLVINGRSTKEFSDADWDTYRNHSIGFVFQSYNLISHQTVLSNVELALTLSGVSREERRRRATEALEKVGLGDQLHKKPNQMSGGQMQRVAIARALVNDPDILLADEPTGALDTATSVQIMELLKEVAKEKLVIMVTHNPELAEQYSTRIIRLVDGRMQSDTRPFAPEVADEAPAAPQEPPKRARKAQDGKGKKSMSFLTALSLSLNNLLTKKTRTLLVSVAGSIGIIGIALILALSNGVNLFIAAVQEDTLSSYPLTVYKETQDMSAISQLMNSTDNGKNYVDTGKIYVDDSLGTMMSAMSATVSNDLVAFKKYIEENPDKFEGLVNDIQYTYDYNLQVFNMVSVDQDGKTVTEAREVGMSVIFDNMGSAFSGMTELMEMSGSMGGMNVFSEMINNQELLDQQYDVIAGDWPSYYDEVVLVVTGTNQISKMTLYMLGLLDPETIKDEMADLTEGKYESDVETCYTYEELLSTKFKLLTTADFFVQTNKTYDNDPNIFTWTDLRDRPDFDRTSFVDQNGIELKISGIIRPKTGVAASSVSGSVGYTRALTDYILNKNAQSAVINQQKAHPTINVLTGLPFERTHYTPEDIYKLVDKIDAATMEIFYEYMTAQIQQNPEFSDRIQVNDTTSFLGMLMLLPEEGRNGIVQAILSAAKANPANGEGLNKLCSYLTYSTGGLITVTPDNFVTLLPLLDLQTQIVPVLVGIPNEAVPAMSMTGLIEMAGESAMQAIYQGLTESIKAMSVNREIFVALLATMKADDPAFIQLEETLYSMAPQIDATYESVLDLLDDAEAADPASISFFSVDFASKEELKSLLDEYSTTVDKLEYSDLVGDLMEVVTDIVDAISYVLVAFVSISLVVSSIMIGIITYISVLERTKEIGILRAIGASKKDISRVFNAETLIIGFAAGLIGILTTVLLCIPINLIIRIASGLTNINASLPLVAAIALVVISMVLTLIAGLIPSAIASKKDPVVALRTE